jgi:CheY-like chemotaxis protein
VVAIRVGRYYSAFKDSGHPMVEHSRSRHTVLLIEPNRNLARITGRALQDHGFVVTQVAAGGEALEVLGTQYPDAVVLDPDLTDGAGTLVLDRLRQLEQREGPSPVWIVISALDRRDVARQYGPAIPYFLAKPFDPWDLVKLLEELL